MKAYSKSKMLKTSRKKSGMRSPRSLLLLIVGLGLVSLTSCRTCKCPAYSEVITTNTELNRAGS